MTDNSILPSAPTAVVDLERRVAELEAALAQARRDAGEAQELAAAAQRTTRDFLANMSHEIRTPMNGVMGMLELAMDTNLSPAQREYSRTAFASAESLLAMVNNILDFSRIDAGDLELHTGDFSLRERLTEVVDTLARRGRDKGLDVSIEFAPAVPPRVSADLARIRQVVVNLMGNAIKFTERGTVQLHVDVAEASAGSMLLRFCVRDTGIGVTPDRQQMIFDAFRQADSSETRRFDGVGLGLTISRALVERMGGTMWLESEPGIGSVFYFTARVAVAPARPAALNEAPVAARSDAPPHVTPRVNPEHSVPPSHTGTLPAQPQERLLVSSPLRVLLAEDNAVNQKLMLSLLGRDGHTVDIAANGQEAVELAAQSDFDVVLMDVQMPVLGGIEATEQIREWERKVGGHVPIIALTARAVEGGREACLAAGMDGYLPKPVRSADLFALITNLVGHKMTSTDKHKRGELPDEVFDEAELLETVQGDRALLTELGHLFLEDAPQQVAAMRDAIARADAPALRFAAHALKGSAGTMTARRVAKHARTLEVLASEGKPLSDAAAPMEELERALDELRVRLSSLQAG